LATSYLQALAIEDGREVWRSGLGAPFVGWLHGVRDGVLIGDYSPSDQEAGAESGNGAAYAVMAWDVDDGSQLWRIDSDEFMAADLDGDAPLLRFPRDGRDAVEPVDVRTGERGRRV